MLRVDGLTGERADGRQGRQQHGLETTPPRSGAVSFLLSPRVTTLRTNGRRGQGRGLRSPSLHAAGPLPSLPPRGPGAPRTPVPRRATPVGPSFNWVQCKTGKGPDGRKGREGRGERLAKAASPALPVSAAPTPSATTAQHSSRF